MNEQQMNEPRNPGRFLDGCRSAVWNSFLIALSAGIFTLLILLWEWWKVALVAVVAAAGMVARFALPTRAGKLGIYAKRTLFVTLAAGLLLSATGCASGIASWWTDPVVPTSRGIVSRQEWFTKDYMEGYRSWRPECHYGVWMVVPFQWITEVEVAVEVTSALVLPNKIVHIVGPDPQVPNHITMADDPYGLWKARSLAFYRESIRIAFTPPNTNAAWRCGCPHGDCVREWEYFLGIQEQPIDNKP
jgi:hypothetical protein